MVNHTVNWRGKGWKALKPVGIVHSVNGRVLDNYRGSKGYNTKWGRYVGTVGVMLDYLQYQRPDRYNFYDMLLTHHSKRSVPNLTVDELNKLMLEIWELLDYDTQRKFQHYICGMDKDYKEKYNAR